MREILFRGKRSDGDGWIVGDLIHDEAEYNRPRINIGMDYSTGGTYIAQAPRVISETVGQYTGLTDKNGKRIWENDIALIEYKTTTVKGYIKYQGASFYVATSADFWDIDDYCSIRKIGNVYDNPELLE